MSDLCVFVVSYVYLLYYVYLLSYMYLFILFEFVLSYVYLLYYVYLLSYMYLFILFVFVVSYVYLLCYVYLLSYMYLLYDVCIAVLTLDAGLLARSHYPEGPATGHLDTGFSWFSYVCKRMLRWFPSFQVATTCFSCNRPDLNFVVTFFHICVHVK